jgi:uncharacterized protein (DUF924 family)
MESQFGEFVLKTRRNEFENWAEEAEGSVALVALLDQLSRNLFCGSSDAVSADGKARETATKAIA